MFNFTGREAALEALRSELAAVIQKLRNGPGFHSLEIGIALEHLEYAVAELDAALAERDRA